MIEILLSFEVTTKILLGAHLMKMSISPLTYIFNSLNIKMVTLPEEHLEYQMIKAYVNKPNRPGFIKNIFAIEKRGEVERF